MREAVCKALLVPLLPLMRTQLPTRMKTKMGLKNWKLKKRKELGLRRKRKEQKEGLRKMERKDWEQKQKQEHG